MASQPCPCGALSYSSMTSLMQTADIEPNRDLISALHSTSDWLDQDYSAAYIAPKPNVPRLFRILMTGNASDKNASGLPAAWRTTQLALARVSGLQLERELSSHFGERPEAIHYAPLGVAALSNGLPNKYSIPLRRLLVVMYHNQLQQLLQEMNEAGPDAVRQKVVLERMIEPLQQYSNATPAWKDFGSGLADQLLANAVEAVRSNGTELDPIRACLRVMHKPMLMVVKTVCDKMNLRWPPEDIVKAWIDVGARQLVAGAGGLSLIIPLIMMTFLTSVAARLSIVCCCVVGFSGLIGIVTRASNQEVLGATAAYTAVLVVFVGTSSTGKP